MSGLLLDLKTALRSLLRRRLFTAAVLSTLALGIGVNTAIFSVVNALLLSPLPFPEADRLVAVWETVQRDALERRTFSYADFRDLAASTRAFSNLAAYNDSEMTLRLEDRAERVRGEMISAEYLSILGAQPILGRGFLGTEANAEVLLGHDLWQRLGGDPSLLGARLTVDNEILTVAGILPPGFRGLSGVDLWLPLSMVPTVALERRGARWLSVVGRLAPEVSLEQANDELRRIFAALAAEHPRSNTLYSAAAGAMDGDLLGDLRRPLWLLLGAVGLVLLIACANVANLLLIRAAGRRHEVAIRTALGASRARQLRLSLVEALILCVLGGTAAFLVAGWALEWLRFLNPVELPHFVSFELEPRVLAFTVAMTFAIALGLGLVEGLSSHARPSTEQLREGGRQHLAGRSSLRLRRALVCAEVGLALALTIGAGLLDRSLRQLQRIEPGFNASGTLALRLDLPHPQPGEEAGRSQADELGAVLGGLPGIDAMAFASRTPLERDGSAIIISPEGHPADPGAPYDGGLRVYRHEIGPGYFATLGIPLLSGRDFASDDDASDPSTVVVSESLARRAWPGEEAVGKRLKLGRPGAQDPWLEVVGVAADARQRTLAPEPVITDPDLYLPLDWQDRPRVAVAVRSSLPPEPAVQALRQAMTRHDPGIVVYDVTTLEARVRAEAAQPRFNTFLVGLFAALALTLAAVGIYSVMAYLVLERRRELGIRMALGADRRAILALVIRDGMLLVASGVAAGLLLALGLGRVLAAHLYQVSVVDPGAFSAMTLVLFLVAFLACYLPARQASRLDPLRSIRGE